MREAKELSRPSYLISAVPINDDLYLWHFTIRGSKDSLFENGIYHGEIRIHPEYPFKPPELRILTVFLLFTFSLNHQSSYVYLFFLLNLILTSL